MKKSIIFGSLALAGIAFTGCDDFLDDNRNPLTSEVNTPAFWNNETNVQNEANLFYNSIIGYGNYCSRVSSTTTSGQGEFYFKTLSDDQVGRTWDLQNWANTNVPASAASWSDPYYNIRQAMYIIEGMKTSTLDEATKNHYTAIARLNRALQTFDLVKKYGNVFWVDQLLTINDDGFLYSAPTDRDIVMDNVLADLDFAIANIKNESGKFEFSKDMARAAKAEICLFEGTYCKYRTEAENGKKADETRAKKYLEECVKACEPLMTRYTLTPNYLDIYQTTDVGAFGKVSEIIFGKAFKVNIMMHQLVAYTCSSTEIMGISKDAFDSYLFKDGKPLALTSCDKTDLGVLNTVDSVLSIQNLLDVRDERLAKTTDPYAYVNHLKWSRAGAAEMVSTTGYGVAKYDNITVPLYNRQTIGQNYTCGPIYWLSAVYCEFAEAKAELGTLSDADLNNSLNKLYERAGLPTQTVASLSSMNDPANNMNVSSLIWEVRRCRRCELIMDRDFRYWDLIRWHQLDKLDNTRYPNVFLGANFSNTFLFTEDKFINEKDAVKLNSEGYKDGGLGDRVYDKKYYFYPIPSGQIALNDKIKQNPGW